MRYFTLYRESKPLICIDTQKPNRADCADAIYYVDKYQLDGFLSNYKNIFTAEFKRTAIHPDEEKSRLLYLSDIPRRLKPDEAIEFLESLMHRGKDKQPRKMHRNSLENLKPGARFTADNHPIKPRVLTDAQLDKAIELKQNGCSWRKVGDLLKCNASTVRTALRRRGSEPQNRVEKSG